MIPVRSNLHTHTRYGDGANTHREMVQAALAAGFESLGFSEHAYAPYDSDCCIPRGKMADYRREIELLREEYAGSLAIYAGLEVDAFHLHDKSEWDYVIGSVHYVRGKNGYHTIDGAPESFEAAIADLGSARAVAEAYGRSVMELAGSYRPHILGHLDIVTKLVRRGKTYFDPADSWYREMWGEIVRAVAESGCIVEVNTSGIYRGYSREPYPCVEILKLLRERDVPVILSADAHAAANIAGGFEEAALLLKGIGYQKVKVLRKNGFEDAPL